MITNTQEKKLSLDLILQIVIALGLLGYVGYRAAKLDLVYDEACSYFWYARDSLWDIYKGVPPDANNHLFNSLCMKLSVGFFGPSELVLRWHSVAAFGFYLVIVMAWLREIRDPVLRMTGFLLLTCNPYILDFFSLARGYGMAMTFTTGGAMSLCRWLTCGKRRWGWLAVGYGIAAVLSNLCALLFYAALMAIVCLKGIAVSRAATESWRTMLARFWQTTCWAWWGSLGVVLILAFPMIRLMGTDAFYAGGQNSFWRDTIQTLVCDSLYRVDYGILFRVMVYGVEGVVVVSLLAGALMMLLRVWRHQWGALEESWSVMFFLVLTSGLASIVLHVVFKQNYLADRLATFLLPLFLMYVVLLANAYRLETRCLRSIIRGLAIAVMLACGIHFLRSANIKWTYEWRYNYQIRDVLSDIHRDARQRNLAEVRLGVGVLSHPSACYYREVGRLDWLVAVEKDWGGRKFDYYYLKDGLDNLPDGGQDLEIVKVYRDIGTRLLRRMLSPSPVKGEGKERGRCSEPC